MKRLLTGSLHLLSVGVFIRRRAQNTVPVCSPRGGRTLPQGRPALHSPHPPPPSLTSASSPVPDWQLLRSALWNPGRSPRLNEAYSPQARAGDTEGLFLSRSPRGLHGFRTSENLPSRSPPSAAPQPVTATSSSPGLSKHITRGWRSGNTHARVPVTLRTRSFRRT